MFSPMETFEIYPVYNIGLMINSCIFFLLIVATLLISLDRTNTGQIVPSYLNVLYESFYRSIGLMIINFINKNHMMYLPLLFTIFHLILFSNLLGLVPYSYTVTSQLIITLTLSISLLTGIFLIGIFNHGAYIMSVFLPAGTPLLLIPVMILLEIVAFISRILSLGLRLAVNMITGHVLVKVLLGFIYSAYLSSDIFIYFMPLPLLVLSAFLSLEILIAYLQAFIFTFLTCLTIKDLL